jgi:hypothetical protein
MAGRSSRFQNMIKGIFIASDQVERHPARGRSQQLFDFLRETEIRQCFGLPWDAIDLEHDATGTTAD